MAPSSRGCEPEALVERRVLLALGRRPHLLVAKNETGFGHPANIRGQLQGALAPFGPAVVATALSVLQRHTIRWGLGVGSPDLVGSFHGRAFGFELKAEDGVVSPEQERWHAAARRQGMRVDVVRSEGEALSLIGEMEKEWR